MHGPRCPALPRPLVLLAWLGIAACGSPGPVGADAATDGAPPEFPVPPEPLSLEWAPCTADIALVRLGLECATLAVPIDYRDPQGPTIELALSRLTASDPSRRIGSLLYNPGGPGVSGRLDMPALRDALLAGGPSEILARFDIVSFDPRGVSRSTALLCDDVPGYGDLDWSPEDDVERRALQQAVGAFRETCETRTGALVGFLDSWSIARDMDQIRRALGEERVTFLGFSYGTLLGATYADIFPTRVRALVLDSAVDPTLDAATWARERVVGTERAFDALAADCAARPDCAARFGGDIRVAFDDAVRDIAANPLVSPSTGETLDDSLLAVELKLRLIGLPESAAAVESLVEQAAARDVGLVSSLRASAFVQLRNNVPFLCLDYRFAESPLVVADLLGDLFAAAPRLGHADLPLTLPCASWSAGAPHRLPRGSGAPPILVIGSTEDPNTPFAWSEAMAAQLDSGVLLTREGIGHAAIPRSRCVHDVAAAYLIDLEVPPEGMVCPTP